MDVDEEFVELVQSIVSLDSEYDLAIHTGMGYCAGLEDIDFNKIKIKYNKRNLKNNTLKVDIKINEIINYDIAEDLVKTLVEIGMIKHINYNIYFVNDRRVWFVN